MDIASPDLSSKLCEFTKRILPGFSPKPTCGFKVAVEKFSTTRRESRLDCAPISQAIFGSNLPVDSDPIDFV